MFLLSFPRHRRSTRTRLFVCGVKPYVCEEGRRRVAEKKKKCPVVVVGKSTSTLQCRILDCYFAFFSSRDAHTRCRTACRSVRCFFFSPIFVTFFLVFLFCWYPLGVLKTLDESCLPFLCKRIKKKKDATPSAMCYAKQKEGRNKEKKRQFVLMKMANCEPQKSKGRFFCLFVFSLLVSSFFLIILHCQISSCLCHILFSCMCGLFFFYCLCWNRSVFLSLLDISIFHSFFCWFSLPSCFLFVLFRFRSFFLSSFSGLFFLSASLFIVVLLWAFSRKENLWLFYLCFFFNGCSHRCQAPIVYIKRRRARLQLYGVFCTGAPCCKTAYRRKWSASRREREFWRLGAHVCARLVGARASRVSQGSLRRGDLVEGKRAASIVLSFFRTIFFAFDITDIFFLRFTSEYDQEWYFL